MKTLNTTSELRKQQFDRCLIVKIFTATHWKGTENGDRELKAIEAKDGKPIHSITFRNAQRQVETRRKAGQSADWIIIEYPAIAFMGRKTAMIACDISTSRMPSCKGPMPPSPLIDDVACQLHSRGDFVELYEIPNRNIVPAQIPFRTHTSFESEPDQLLGWRSGYPLSGMMAYIKILAQFNAKLTVWRQSLCHE